DIAIAPAPRCLKQRLEMLRLRRADDVQDRLWVPRLDPEADARQVRSHVGKSAVLLLDYRVSARLIIALLRRLQEDDDRPLAARRDARLQERLHHVRQHRAVE